MTSSNNSDFKPEILSPAGSFEKLQVAMDYGADACYLAGKQFGLRSAADNFRNQQIEQATQFAHARGKSVYIVLNSYLHDEDFEGLKDFLLHLDKSAVDSLIISDLGVLDYVAGLVDIPIHLSTQASCLNTYSARFWKRLGVKRLILGREVSIQDAGLIKKRSGLEVELFIGGSMCMAYSGNCVISNYTQGRDSNRGGCAHSCRFEYSLDFGQNKKKNAFFMSSKDLEGLAEIPLFFEQEIDSLKIEGRMKGPLYAGSTARVYRMGVDQYLSQGRIDVNSLREELNKLVHRDFCNGSLVDPAASDSIYNERVHNQQNVSYQAVGTIVEASRQGGLLLKVTNAFDFNSNLEVLTFSGPCRELPVEKPVDLLGRALEKVRPNTIVRFPSIEGVEKGNLVRQYQARI